MPIQSVSSSARLATELRSPLAGTDRAGIAHTAATVRLGTDAGRVARASAETQTRTPALPPGTTNTERAAAAQIAEQQRTDNRRADDVVGASLQSVAEQKAQSLATRVASATDVVTVERLQGLVPLLRGLEMVERAQLQFRLSAKATQVVSASSETSAS